MPAVGSSSSSKARLERERHHDFGGALIAVRQLADQTARLVGEAAHVEQFGDARVHLGVGGARQPRPQAEAGGDFDRDAQIFAHRQFGKDLGDLEGAGDAAPHPARRQQIGDVLAVENDAARRSAAGIR